MQIRRLRLVNFRQHADTDLTFDRGLTGIIGPNGAGKTTLLEAIAWAIYGADAARGRKETIRRRGAPPRSRVEVELEFDLGAHRYRVIRGLQQAALFLDGGAEPVANSLGAVTERLTHQLGMTREEFFNTYFTGQKELAIMAQMSAPERAQFLSRVLGYEKLRAAQLRLKERRRLTQATLDAREAEVADPAELDAAEALASARLQEAEAGAARAGAACQAAAAELAAQRPEGERWEALRHGVHAMQGDLKVAEHAAVVAREQFTRLDRELAEALAAKSRLDALGPVLAPLAGLLAEREALDAAQEATQAMRSLEARRTELLRQLERQALRLAQLPPPESAQQSARSLQAAGEALARQTAEVELRRTAWVREKQDAETQRKNLLSQYEDLREQRRRLELTGRGGNCPTCARPLGDGFETVLEVVRRQMEEVESQGKFYRQRIEQLHQEPADLVELERQRRRLEVESRRLAEATARLEQQVVERARLIADGAALQAQVGDLAGQIAEKPRAYDAERHGAVKREIAELEPRRLEAERHRVGAERAGALVSDAAGAEQELSRQEAEVRRLQAALAQAGWSPEGYERARESLRAAERAVQAAEVEQARAAGELTAALVQRSEVGRRREERSRRLAELRRLADTVLLQQEVDRALGDLRTDLNNTLRPDLSELASGFLRDLTTGRYTDLELDEDYVATIVEEGDPKPVISGGEEDVANLALRLAISQMIAERAGQPLSLLVLDEVFGSLDEDRRASVLDLLRRLADRFPQVILITHVESVRDGFDRVIRLHYDVEERVARAVPESRDAA